MTAAVLPALMPEQAARALNWETKVLIKGITDILNIVTVSLDHANIDHGDHTRAGERATR